ncbi:MAG: hypothetical protein ACLQQ4_00035 [Bacteroidia bacterium]
MKKISFIILSGLFSISLAAQIGTINNSPPPPPPVSPSPQGGVNGAAPPPPMSPVQPQPPMNPSPQGVNGAAPPPPMNPVVQPVNQSGVDKIFYIDNHGNPSSGMAMIPMGEGSNPRWIAKWSQADNMGNPVEGGRLFESFGYLGSNGFNYQTRVVAHATGYPNKMYEVHFQSKQFGVEEEYHDGRVIILDWNRRPWEVRVDYSNTAGIFFTFVPMQQ